MNDDFSWLDYDEPESSAANTGDADSGGGRGLRRFLPRLPKPRLPRLRRGRGTDESARPSASDILGGQADRPIEELDSRLRALRDRSAADQQPSLEGHQALYDVDEVLATPAFQQKPGGVISAVALSKAQQQQVEMLKDIVGGSLRSQDGSGRSSPVFSLSAAPRLIVSALLALTVSLPFVSSDYVVGDLPPVEFSQDRPDARTAYNLLDNLTRDDYVLVAFEYGPTAAGELDALADLFLRHIFAQLAKPVIVSSNPIAIAHAQNIIAAINRSVTDAGISLENNRDYFLLRYLPGGALGLRELSENFDDLARVSAKGQLTGLEFSSLDEMSLLLLIAESAEDARIWAEQVLPETDGARLIAATGYAAEPLAQVYADSRDEIIGLIVGYRDAYTYGQHLDAAYGAPGAVEPPVPPSDEPEEPLQIPEVEPAPINEAPEPQAERDTPTATPSATATMPSIPSPLPTFTPLPTATATPTDVPAPTATLEPVLYVEVTAPRLANIRRGPTTAEDVLAVASAGDRFEVLGTNGDGSWYNILLANGLKAWIAAFLVEERIETPVQERASAGAPRERTLLRLDFTFRLGKNQARFYQVSAPLGDKRAFIFARDRSAAPARLDAMTLGALGATLVIIMGNAVAAASAFGRRRREPQRS